MNELGSKGFGFVTIDTKQGSEAARAASNDIVVNGRVIEVFITESTNIFIQAAEIRALTLARSTRLRILCLY
ncbi:hypothetical protein KIN20_031563 [Parelaphostrongylus tenuis]|uniref:RRM domain-containing protein n=1 Tax=Parelaphostrongylus tenuis TaxID=148309 RepID=A0AAD5WHB2_PARTN|nr:hypothetical protein KIN20_031563 [Parelaphostrongylus tenuis]